MDTDYNMRRHVAWKVYLFFKTKGITEMGYWNLYEDGIIDPGNIKHDFNPINAKTGLQTKCIIPFYKVNPIS